jgi:hypothetical protein
MYLQHIAGSDVGASAAPFDSWPRPPLRAKKMAVFAFIM